MLDCFKIKNVSRIAYVLFLNINTLKRRRFEESIKNCRKQNLDYFSTLKLFLLIRPIEINITVGNEYQYGTIVRSPNCVTLDIVCFQKGIAF